jgi:hypothetical protein
VHGYQVGMMTECEHVCHSLVCLCELYKQSSPFGVSNKCVNLCDLPVIATFSAPSLPDGMRGNWKPNQEVCQEKITPTYLVFPEFGCSVLFHEGRRGLYWWHHYTL